MFPGHKDALVNSIIDGSVKFKGSPLIMLQDLQGLKGGHGKDEDNYLSNFVIELYLKLLAETAVGDLKVETLEWETFEKGVDNRRQVTDILKDKSELLHQDTIFVPCNPHQSKHWFLLVVMPKEKRIRVICKAIP